MNIIIGSARIDERGSISGGAVGDQKQKTSPDYKGEVSMQNFYVHKKGWYIIRPKDPNHAIKIVNRMVAACNNINLGYDQSNRLGVIKNGINTKTKTECDCSSLVRACVKEATGKDPGDFNTSSEASALGRTGLFEAKKVYVSGTKLYEGDILVTKTKGHTVVVTVGYPRSVSNETKQYYPIYKGNSVSIVTALQAVGEKDTSYTHRGKIATANGIKGYEGSAGQNTKMVNLIKEGKLIKA